jgi:DNA-binding protein H-NS
MNTEITKEELDQAVVKVLTRKNSLRRLMREQPLFVVEKVAADIIEIKEEVEEAELEKLEVEQERARKRDEILKLLEENGLSPADIASDASLSTKKERKPVEPKYVLNDVYWSGRGRMPVVFKEYVEKYGSLDDCLIDSGCGQ